MQVQPNSTIYLLAGVPIDKGYNYSLHFETQATQEYVFRQHIMQNGTFTAQQYTRPERGQLKVAVCADDVINCNYIMFKNDGILNNNHRYKNKWFYAFANVEYLNENACIVKYEIDDIQTWMFDYEFEECFVEREHAITDVAGDNLQPEPVDTGELVAQAEVHTGFGDYMLGAIVVSEEIRRSNGELIIDDVHDNYDGHYEMLGADTTAKNTVFTPNVPWHSAALNADASTGISNGLYIYTGLLISESDWSNYFQNNISSYYINNPAGYWIDSVDNRHETILTLGRLIQAIVKGKVTGVSGVELSEANIVACYQYPANFHLRSNIDNAITNGWKAGIFEQANTQPKPTQFKYGLQTSDWYTPVNKKLLTAPFMKMLVSSQTGSTGEFRYEFFKGTNTSLCYYSKMGTYFCQPSAMFVPKNYKGKEKDFDSSLISSPYPVPIYKGDALQTWLQSNKNSFFLGAISSAVSTVFGAVTGKPMTAASGAAGILGTIGSYVDKSNVPPNTYYQAQNEVLSVGTKRTAFHIYEMALTPEYARKIDSFFTKYGYATNELKIPNLQRQHDKRQWWNYLKVKNCMLHGTLPADVEQHLEQIYENGITMWTYDLQQLGQGGGVGDYSRPNPVHQFT